MGFAIDEAPSSLSEGARAMPLDRKAGDTLLTNKQTMLGSSTTRCLPELTDSSTATQTESGEEGKQKSKN